MEHPFKNVARYVVYGAFHAHRAPPDAVGSGPELQYKEHGHFGCDYLGKARGCRYANHRVNHRSCRQCSIRHVRCTLPEVFVQPRLLIGRHFRRIFFNFLWRHTGSAAACTACNARRSDHTHVPRRDLTAGADQHLHVKGVSVIDATDVGVDDDRTHPKGGRACEVPGAPPPFAYRRSCGIARARARRLPVRTRRASRRLPRHAPQPRPHHRVCSSTHGSAWHRLPFFFVSATSLSEPKGDNLYERPSGNPTTPTRDAWVRRVRDWLYFGTDVYVAYGRRRGNRRRGPHDYFSRGGLDIISPFVGWILWIMGFYAASVLF